MNELIASVRSLSTHTNTHTYTQIYIFHRIIWQSIASYVMYLFQQKLGIIQRKPLFVPPDNLLSLLSFFAIILCTFSDHVTAFDTLGNLVVQHHIITLQYIGRDRNHAQLVSNLTCHRWTGSSWTVRVPFVVGK